MSHLKISKSQGTPKLAFFVSVSGYKDVKWKTRSGEFVLLYLAIIQ